EDGQSGRTFARGRRALHALAAADVEVEPVANDQAAAAGRLDVAPVPVAGFLRDGDERPAVGAVPVEAVPAEAGADRVRLGPVARLPTPDGEEAEQHALVADGVEVVELATGLEIVADRVELVGPDPRGRLVGLPLRPGQGVGMLPVVARAAVAVGAQA